MFRELCSPFHQCEEQPDTELFLQAVPFYITLLVRVVGEEGEENCGWRREEDGENWLVFNNRENGLPYFIYVVAIISI